MPDEKAGWVDAALEKIQDEDLEKLNGMKGGAQQVSHVNDVRERRKTSRKLNPHELTSLRAAEKIADARIASEK